MLWSPNVTNCVRETNINDMYKNVIETIKNNAKQCDLKLVI